MTRSRVVPGRFLTLDRVALGFAAVVILLAAASTESPAEGTSARDLDGWAVLLLMAAAALLLGSARFPGSVALAVLGLSYVWYGVGYTSGLINVTTLAAFYSLGVSEGQRRKLVLTAVTVGLLVLGMAGFGEETVESALTASGYVVMAVLFGELIRSRHLLVDHLAARAERAEADAERRVIEERLQIARDVHDVLAHTVSVVTVQAAVAEDAFDRDPDAARAAVQTIRHAGRDAMGEVRATVAVLRSGAGPTGTTPSPRLDDVEDLVERAREQGLPVEMDVVLSGRDLPEMVELTAYRVVQEGITNMMRHARATEGRVTIREDAGSLVVEVHDNGRGNGSGGVPGFGLRGMAERVESIGGQLAHGRGRDGGWTVRASLPLPVATP